MPSVHLPLCVRIDEQDKFSRESLLADGWREIEILDIWYLEEWGNGRPVDIPVREGYDLDIPRCQWIASTSFVHDRFHADPQFDDALADRLKSEWVAKAFAGEADKIYVAEFKGIAGFVFCNREGDETIINLIATDRRRRNQGIGRALLQKVIAEFGPPIRAGTQRSNRPARTLYEALGFEILESKRTFHKG